MTKKYTHLQPEQRYQIEGFLKAGKSLSEISSLIGVHKSTISRELRRNRAQGVVTPLKYQASVAIKKTRYRHWTKNKREVFTDQMKAWIRQKLENDKWSPEFISVIGRREFGQFVCHEIIYQWIWRCKHSKHAHERKDNYLYTHLRHGRRKKYRGNKRDNRGIIHHRVSIEKRPQLINKRMRIGDLEADLIMGTNYQPGILIMTDRKTRMNWLEKIVSKETNYIENKIRKIIDRCEHDIKSITFDNDLAFATHYKIKESLNIKTFFTHPYSSQEKGTVENRIGTLRRFFPKKTNFEKITAREIARVENKMNDRPMRMFNYATPKEKYSKMMLLRC